MSLNHGSVTIQQSLPSFAQTFSSSSMNAHPAIASNALPPIYTNSRQSSADSRRAEPIPSRPPINSDKSGSFNRKRIRSEDESATKDKESPREIKRSSPRTVRVTVHVKEEEEDQDEDMLDMGAPPPSSLRPAPAKKRRTNTVETPHPLITNLSRPATVDQGNLTPISPVVMGFTMPRDDPGAIEQVRSMITVKQKQQALIEQRRGSHAGILSTSSNGSHPDERVNGPQSASRTAKRSPKSAVALTSGHSWSRNAPLSARPLSPSPITVPSQQPPVNNAAPHAKNPSSDSTHFPPPPISIARRRGQSARGMKRPSDLIIKPRGAYTEDQYQPLIQSAPPIPQAGGQHQFYTQSAPMALPSLPLFGAVEQPRRPAAGGQVPPTPTRFALHRKETSIQSISQTAVPALQSKSPPSSTIAIASSLVAANTASSPSTTEDKAAFIAPFSTFFDALADAQQLKAHLSNQVAKSNQLMASLQQQQEKMDEIVDGLVERKMIPMRDELAGLHRRLEDLEEALHAARADGYVRRPSVGDIPLRPWGKQPLPGRMLGPSEAYTFPPTSTSPNVQQKRPSMMGRSSHDLERDLDHPNGPPHDARRLSISSSRMDTSPQPPPPPRTTFNIPSPPREVGRYMNNIPPSNSWLSVKGGRSAPTSTHSTPNLPHRTPVPTNEEISRIPLSHSRHGSFKVPAASDQTMSSDIRVTVERSTPPVAPSTPADPKIRQGKPSSPLVDRSSNTNANSTAMAVDD